MYYFSYISDTFFVIFSRLQYSMTILLLPDRSP